MIGWYFGPTLLVSVCLCVCVPRQKPNLNPESGIKCNFFPMLENPNQNLKWIFSFLLFYYAKLIFKAQLGQGFVPMIETGWMDENWAQRQKK